MADDEQAWQHEMTIYGPWLVLEADTPSAPPPTGTDGAGAFSSEYSLHFKVVSERVGGFG